MDSKYNLSFWFVRKNCKSKINLRRSARSMFRNRHSLLEVRFPSPTLPWKEELSQSHRASREKPAQITFFLQTEISIGYAAVLITWSITPKFLHSALLILWSAIFLRQSLTCLRKWWVVAYTLCFSFHILWKCTTFDALCAAQCCVLNSLSQTYSNSIFFLATLLARFLLFWKPEVSRFCTYSFSTENSLRVSKWLRRTAFFIQAFLPFIVWFDRN